MNTHAAATIQPQPPTQVDFGAVKTRQQGAWSSGDYAVVGTTLQIVGEDAVRSARPPRRARGAGRRGRQRQCDPGRRAALVRRVVDGLRRLRCSSARGARRRGRLDIEFREADAEALPFARRKLRRRRVDLRRDVHARPGAGRGRDWSRVCRRGGKIGLANWTPDGFIGQLFKTIGKHLPPPAGVQSPALWGTRDAHRTKCSARTPLDPAEPRNFVFRYRSPQHCLDVFRTYYGPMLKAFAALPATAGALTTTCGADRRFNRSGDTTMVVSSEYLEIVVTRY